MESLTENMVFDLGLEERQDFKMQSKGGSMGSGWGSCPLLAGPCGNARTPESPAPQRLLCSGSSCKPIFPKTRLVRQLVTC